MKIIYSGIRLVAFVLVAVTFGACGAGDLNKKASTVADTFYTDIQKKDYAAAIELCSSKAFATDSKQSWTKSLQKNGILLGAVKSFTKVSGFNISTSTTTGTLVTVAYDVQWQYGNSRDSVTLIRENDGSMKVFNYHWYHKNASYIDQIGASVKEAQQYMDDVKAADYDAALGLCSEEALKITPKENWKTFLSKATSRLGAISGYSIMKDSCTYHIEASGQTGLGNYYDIYIKSQRGAHAFKEKIVFFQQNYEQPVKLIGHSFL